MTIKFLFCPHLLAVLLILFVFPVEAQQQAEDDLEIIEMLAPGMQAETEAMITRIETAYIEAIKDLDAEQLAYLKKLEDEERAIAAMDYELISMAGPFKDCIDFNPEIGANRDFYQSAFQRLQRIKAAEKYTRLKQHQEQIYRTNFINQKILADHLRSLSLVVMNEQAQKAVAVAGATDCDEVKAMFSKYDLLPGNMCPPLMPIPQENPL